MGSFLIDDNAYDIFNIKVANGSTMCNLSGYYIIDEECKSIFRPLLLRFIISKANTPYTYISSTDVKLRNVEQMVLQLVNIESDCVSVPYISSDILNFKLCDLNLTVDTMQGRNTTFTITPSGRDYMKGLLKDTIVGWIRHMKCASHEHAIISTTIDDRLYDLHIHVLVYGNTEPPIHDTYLKVLYVLKNVNGTSGVVYFASENISSNEELKDFINKFESFRADISNHDNYLQSLEWDIYKSTTNTGKTTTLSDIVTNQGQTMAYIDGILSDALDKTREYLKLAMVKGACELWQNAAIKVMSKKHYDTDGKTDDCK